MSRSFASAIAVPWTEWQRPTWRIAGWRTEIAHALIAIGLTCCKRIVSGQTASMSSQTDQRCGTVRRPRMNTVERAPMKAILGNDIATQPRGCTFSRLREKVATKPTDEGRRNYHDPSPRPLYEVFFVKRKICVVSGPGRRVGGPLEARSCPSKPWRRKMSLARRLSRPKPPEAVAEGQPLQGSGQRRRSAAEVGGPRLRPSLA